VEATKPPDTVRDTSEAQAAALNVSARVRKRAAAGTGPRRPTPLTGAQAGISAGTAYRSLLGG
jgi:hypothetical protein